MEAMVIERRLNWLAKVWRMGWDRLPKIVLFGVLDESNGNTGQKSYQQQVKQDLIKFGLAKYDETEDWKEQAMNKQEWKKLVRKRRDDYFMRRFYEKEKMKHDARATGKRKIEDDAEEDDDEEEEEEEEEEDEVKVKEEGDIFGYVPTMKRQKRETLISSVKRKRRVMKRKK
jgi:hypothetical protein